MSKGYIYKTTNLLNGHFYIGQKNKDIFDPAYYGSGTILQRAIKKYGKENFKIEVLEFVDLEILNEREIFHIAETGALLSENYNITKGGTGGDTISNHPNRAEIISGIDRSRTQEQNARVSKSLKEVWQQKFSNLAFDTVAYKQMCSNRSKTMWADNAEILEKRKQTQSAQSKLNYEKDPTLRDRVSAGAKESWDKNAISYKVTFPDGHTEIIKILQRWCNENGYPFNTLYWSMRSKKVNKGWMVEKL